MSKAYKTKFRHIGEGYEDSDKIVAIGLTSCTKKRGESGKRKKAVES
ncbi:MAG: hypothetical protein ACLFVP_00615 [Candidatus Bathyarchaeia archaeon]